MQPTVQTEIEVRTASSSWAIHVDTDDGEFFIKVANNPEGPGVLINEWIGACVARLLGVPTPVPAIVNLPETIDITLPNGQIAEHGLVFGSKREKAQPWGGKSSIDAVENTDCFSRLVVLDTLILNVDRYSFRVDGSIRKNPGNLLLSEQGASAGRFMLRAIDHGHCLLGPDWRKSDLEKIANIKDPRLFGLFPEFQEKLNKSVIAKALDLALEAERLRECLDQIPAKWRLGKTATKNVIKFLKSRASFLSSALPQKLWPQSEFF